jgi:hypothetical protein
MLLSGQQHTSAALAMRKNSATLRVGVWVPHIAGLDVLKKGKITLLRQDSKSGSSSEWKWLHLLRNSSKLAIYYLTQFFFIRESPICSILQEAASYPDMLWFSSVAKQILE